MAASRARAFAFFALAAFILLAPAYKQLFGGTSRWVRGWQMYRQIGFGTYDVVFDLRSADGSTRRLTVAEACAFVGRELRPLDRFKAPEVLRLGRRVAERAGPDTRVLVTARTPGEQGWRQACTEEPLESLQERYGRP